jgi:hypothetical protein
MICCMTARVIRDRIEMPVLFAFCVWSSAEPGHHGKAASRGEVSPLGVSVSLGITSEAVDRVG